ncbi:MAG TPA: ATP-binding protein [Candidatus Binatia bacterium]|nr:ATP-binding protein [Candidatus Binatia bacterium]
MSSRSAADERLQAIVASVSEAIITLDAAQRIVLFNPAAERLFRCAAAEAIGGTLERFIPAPSRARHAEYVAEFGRTEAGIRSMGKERLLTGVRADGEHFPMEAQISHVTTRGKRFYTVVIRDVTERKQADAEREALHLREREARARAEAATLAAERVQMIVDAALVDLPVDDLLRELLDRIRSVLETDTAVILLREGDVLRVRAALGVEEEIQRQVRVPIGEGFAGRVASDRRPMVLEDVDYGKVVSAYLRTKGIRSLAGIPLLIEGRVLGVLHVGSLHTRQFGDDELRVLQLAGERIAVAIERAQASEAEREARAAAEAANRAKDAFLSTVSHELRTPLTAMLSWLRVLRDGRVKGEKAERALETVERTGQAQAKLIDDLLDVSRILGGRMRLELCVLDLADLVHEAVEALRPMADQKGIAVGLALAAARVSGDPDRLQQVAWNLVHNALKFTPCGGRVDVELTARSDDAVLVVRDTGRGIDGSFLPFLFTRFQQAQSVESRGTGGLGLGLSIARHLVELHGGSITADSGGDGAGATFTVRLPLHGRVSLPATAGLPRLDGIRVLIVDDEANAREALQALFEQAGAQVRTAGSVREARAALEADALDVLVSDIRLPDADGYELVRGLRATTQLRALPAVAITAYHREEEEQAALDAGFQLRFRKPIEPVHLMQAIADLAAASRDD